MPIVLDFADLLKVQTASNSASTTTDLSEIGENPLNFETLFHQTEADLSIPLADLIEMPQDDANLGDIDIVDWNSDGAIEEMPTETLAKMLNIPHEELVSAIAKVAHNTPTQTTTGMSDIRDPVILSAADTRASEKVLITSRAKVSSAKNNPPLHIPTPDSFKTWSDAKSVESNSQPDTTNNIVKTPTGARVTVIAPAEISIPAQRASSQQILTPSILVPDTQTNAEDASQIEFETNDLQIKRQVEGISTKTPTPQNLSYANMPLPVRLLHNEIQITDFDSAIDTDQNEITEPPTSVSASSTFAAPSLQRNAHVPIVQQILRNLPQTEITKPQQYDIELSPRELGHVKITMVPTDASMNILINCERDETSNLLRRNLSDLTQDMHDIGYANVDIEFGQNSQDASNSHQFDTQHENDNLEQPTTTPADPLTITVGGVDLKI